MLELIESSLECLGKVLTKKGRLAFPPPASPMQMQPRVDPASQSTRPPTSDASTDTILTPSWWDSEKTVAARAASRRRPARVPANAAQRNVNTDTEDETAMETDAAGTWANVTRRRRRRTKTAAPEPGPPAPKPPARITSVAKKPPAILIKTGDGKTFADTVRSVRSCGLTAQELGASVTMRETRDGALLLELPKGAKSAAAAKSIAEALGSKLGDCWESVPTWRPGRG